MITSGQKYSIALLTGDTIRSPKRREYLDRRIDREPAPSFNTDPCKILCRLETAAERRYARKQHPRTPQRVWVQAFVHRCINDMYEDHNPIRNLLRRK